MIDRRRFLSWALLRLLRDFERCVDEKTPSTVEVPWHSLLYSDSLPTFELLSPQQLRYLLTISDTASDATSEGSRGPLNIPVSVETRPLAPFETVLHPAGMRGLPIAYKALPKSSHAPGVRGRVGDRGSELVPNPAGNVAISRIRERIWLLLALSIFVE